MAGIGFELRKVLRQDGLFSLLRAYGLAGLVSSGPWVLSIVGVLLIGVMSAEVVQPAERVVQFLVSITYLMAGSLLLTGPLQLMFSRFVADRHFEGKQEAIVPNLMGALLLTTLVSAWLGGGVVVLLFEGESTAYRLLMVCGFVTLCDSWILVVLLSGIKAYRAVLGLFFVGYLVSVTGAILLRPFGLEGLLQGFLAGQQLMVFLMLALALREYPSARLFSLDFLRRSQAVYSLGVIGLLMNAGVWADKLVFWFNPRTSSPVIGPLRYSQIYDLPIFLAYLSVIPGMAVFLLRVETDFAEQYQRFFRLVREGAPLGPIGEARQEMVRAVRRGIYEILKVQGLTVLLLLLAGRELLELAGISTLYVHLLYLDAVGVAVQVVLLATLNVLFYLDARRSVLALSLLFAVGNAAGTLLTQRLGAQFYGYGFATAGLVTSLVGLVLLSRKLEWLEFETFMLQRS